MLIDFFWVWLYLRFFMRVYTSEAEFQVGDLTEEFAMSTFMPSKVEPAVKGISEVCFAFFNMCGFVNLARNWLAKKEAVPMEARNVEKKPMDEKKGSKADGEGKTQKTARKEEDPKETNERKKLAMEFLEKQIQEFSKTAKSKKDADGWDDGKGDLAFDDLAIDFEKAMKSNGK